MTKSQITKRALFSSVVALFLCFSMLLGTTFAWFTDSETSGRNIIRAGNLDVVLEYKTEWSNQWQAVTEGTKLFKEGALYEPGYTEVVFLRVSNAGSLALKYNLNVNVYGETKSTNVGGETFSLKDHLAIGYYVQDEYSSGANYADLLMPSMFATKEAALRNVTLTTLSADTGIVTADGPLLPGTDTAQVVAIVLTMPETVGNEANHKEDVAAPTVDLGVTLVATQFTHESDSFGNDYDQNATYPTMPDRVKVEGTDKTAVLNAIANAKDGDIITLSDNVTIAGYDATNKLVLDKPIVLDLNGKTVTTESGWGGIDLKNGASIVNGTINHTGNTAAIKAFNVGKIENVTINVTETAGKTKGGIVVQEGDCSIGSMKNVTINGATNGIECNRTTSALAIGRMENVAINATANGIYLNGAGRIGIMKNCTINGSNIGINAYLANLWHISLNLEGCQVTGGTTGIDMWDEAATNTGSTVTLTYDTATTFTGSRENIKATLQAEITYTENGVNVPTGGDIRK